MSSKLSAEEREEIFSRNKETIVPASRPLQGERLQVFKAKARFLELFPEYANITKTCEALGLSRGKVQRWVKGDAAFAAAFDEAKEIAADNLEAVMWEHAVKGVDRPIFQTGKQVGTIREYDHTLMIFLAKALRPEKYREARVVEHTGPGGGPVQVEAVRERILGRILELAPAGTGEADRQRADAG